MDNSLIDRIRESTDIVQIISSYLPLKRVGTNWRGVCPFHKDTHPSLFVSQPKQIFKCFACGKAGNAFTFVQEYEHLSFIEAVKELAKRSGIPVPEYEKTKVVSTRRDQLLQVYKAAGEFFGKNLFEHGQNVLDYLAERKISAETAKKLELGYALNSEKALINHLMKQGFGVALLKESGLFYSASGGLGDFFKDRLIFPIHNSIGQVLAFGGRSLSPDAKAQKLYQFPARNSIPRANELYGLFKSKYEIGRENYALVCEGYFDFLRVYGSGFLNCVATLGTALTEEQIYLLVRYTHKIYMLYDGDNAGKKAAIRGALLCLSKGLSPHVIELPQGHDPDTFILEHGAEALKARIKSALHIIEYYASPKAQNWNLREDRTTLMRCV
jgi:DNA primase